MPKVSIIVPVYKVEPYLRRCIDSILAQTYTDFELILVDDGSPDKCGEICDEYAIFDRRIRVIHQENSGLAEARNSGIRKASGDYLLFCDSDDYVANEWCESLVKCLSNEENRYIFGGIQVVYSDGSTNQIKQRIPISQKNRWPISHFFDLQLKNQIGYAWNVLYDANIIRDKGILFSKEYIIEDLPFNLEYIRYADCIYYAGIACYFYVQDERATLSRKYYSDGFRKWKEKYALSVQFVENNYDEKEITIARTKIANTYLFHFLQALDDSFDVRNKASFISKMRYNVNVVKSKEFQDCLLWADNHNEDKRIIWLLKKKLYPVAWSLNKLAKKKAC